MQHQHTQEELRRSHSEEWNTSQPQAVPCHHWAGLLQRSMRDGGRPRAELLAAEYAESTDRDVTNFLTASSGDSDIASCRGKVLEKRHAH